MPTKKVIKKTTKQSALKKKPKKKILKTTQKKTTQKKTATPVKKVFPKGNNSSTPKKSLSSKLLKHYRELLLISKSKIVKDVHHIQDQHLNSHRESSGDLSGYSLHMADVGTDNYERELALDLVGNEQDLIYQIDAALERIKNKTYGFCELLKSPIPAARLEVIPWTPYSKEAAEQIENETGRGRGGRY